MPFNIASIDLHEEGQIDAMHWEVAYEDIKGTELDPNEVRKARMEEMEFMKRPGAYEVAPIEQCRNFTGHVPVSVKWVDTN